MRLLLLFLWLSLISSELRAQPGALLNDSLRLQNNRIDDIFITGNHKTRPTIIYRELIFHKGDTLPYYVLEAAVNRSRENLMNTGLFNFVDIKIYPSGRGSVSMHIELTERWYLWPMPIFQIADRNFNEWIQRGDWSRVNVGMNITQENFRGMDESLRLQFLFGYTQRFGIFYNIPYINRQQNLGISFGVFGSRNREITYNTFENKLLFYQDPNQFVRNDFQTFVRLTKRRGIYDYYSTTVDYRNTQVQDTVLSLNPEYFVEQSTKQQSLGISWSYRHDHRDYQAYALRGFLIEFEASLYGGQILPVSPTLISMGAGARVYQPLQDRLTLSSMIKGRITQREQAPFFNQRALGYGNDYLRGYEYYVLNGQNYFLNRNSLKFTLLPQQEYTVKAIPNERFNRIPLSIFVEGFFDAGYVQDRFYDEGNPLSNQWQYGYGAGLHIVTYYDLVFRFEYSFNRMNENGIFFHVGAPF